MLPAHLANEGKVPQHNILLYLNVGDFCQMRRFDLRALAIKLTERKFDLEQWAVTSDFGTCWKMSRVIQDGANQQDWSDQRLFIFAGENMQKSTGTKDWHRITRKEGHLFRLFRPNKPPTVLFSPLAKCTVFSGIYYPSSLEPNHATLQQKRPHRQEGWKTMVCW